MKWQNLFSVKNKNNILKCLRDNLHEMSKLTRDVRNELLIFIWRLQISS